MDSGSASESPQLTKEQQEQRTLEGLIEKIHYSDRYTDDAYEYRHVILPKPLLRLVPKQFFNEELGVLRLLSEPEWRGIGITQSLGWEHYEVHAPEPHVLLFRRPKDFVPPQQHANSKAGASQITAVSVSDFLPYSQVEEQLCPPAVDQLTQNRFFRSSVYPLFTLGFALGSYSALIYNVAVLNIRKLNGDRY
ncbi:regulatory subunit of cyclin-dependent kinase [Mycena olivaceomarginata]|nr:regulatory subunit of cyclin-dependent kinase [Mycena olivaceomarginata]